MIGLVLGIILGALIQEFKDSFSKETLDTTLALFRSFSNFVFEFNQINHRAANFLRRLSSEFPARATLNRSDASAQKALLYFEIVTTLALFVGLAAVNIVQPGKGVTLAGVVKTEDKAILAERAKELSKEATDAVNRAAELRSQTATNPNAFDGSQ